MRWRVSSSVARCSSAGAGAAKLQFAGVARARPALASRKRFDACALRSVRIALALVDGAGEGGKLTKKIILLARDLDPPTPDLRGPAVLPMPLQKFAAKFSGSISIVARIVRSVCNR